MKKLIASVCLYLSVTAVQADDSQEALIALAESGDGNTQYQLAERYKNGDGIAEDKSKAVEWYAKAADLGNADAMMEMSYAYGSGEVVPKDVCKSFHYGKRAAELGHVHAQYVTGLKYAAGRCGSPDPASALWWLEKAVEQGNAEVASTIAFKYHYKKDGFQTDYVKALYWYEKAVAMGDYTAAEMLGIVYSTGDIGANKDYAKAVHMFKKAIEMQKKYSSNGSSIIDEISEINSVYSIAYLYANGGYGLEMSDKTAGEYIYVAYKLYGKYGCFDSKETQCKYVNKESVKMVELINDGIKSGQMSDSEAEPLEAFWVDYQARVAAGRL